jgi:hypothetical protein
MNFQEKMLETAVDLRARATALANEAISNARTRAQVAARRVSLFKGSFATVAIAGRELNKVARRHAARFVQENSSLAVSAGKDVSALALTTYAALTTRAAPAKVRKSSAARKRATRKAN